MTLECRQHRIPAADFPQQEPVPAAKPRTRLGWAECSIETRIRAVQLSGLSGWRHDASTLHRPGPRFNPRLRRGRRSAGCEPLSGDRDAGLGGARAARIRSPSSRRRRSRGAYAAATRHADLRPADRAPRRRAWSTKSRPTTARAARSTGGSRADRTRCAPAPGSAPPGRCGPGSRRDARGMVSWERQACETQVTRSMDGSGG